METPFSSLLSSGNDAVSWLTREIRHLCLNHKKRAPGSDGEREAAAYMASLLKTECGCPTVWTETFAEHPDAFWGYLRFSMVCDALCAVTFFLHPALSLFFGGCALFLFLFQFILYKPVIDPLFAQRTGTNVTAVRPCSGEVRRRILLNGHMDAAWEFPLNYRFGGIVFEIPGLMALLGVLFYLVLSVLSLCGAAGSVRTAALAGLLFLPFFVLVGFTYDPRRIVDGANDDLSGCFLGIALLREMEKRGIVPEHTEVGVVLTGSEEAGLQGAKAWCKAHRDDFRDVPTLLFCLDTIHSPKFLMVNERDLNGTVASDPTACKAFLSAAKAAGIPCSRGWVPPFGGSTDSAAFTQGGFRSAGITGLDHKLEDYYHTRRDSFDRLDEQGLENCYLALVHLAAAMDRGEWDALP